VIVITVYKVIVSNEVLLNSLTAALRRERIQQRLTQEELAKKAHLSPNPVRRLEQGQGVQLTAFLAMVEALGLSERLLRLFPEHLTDPREVAAAGRARSEPRKRVSRTSADDEVWTWGEDA
jgi:transcriptional regulator with XRE-family HTH domain